MAARKYNEFPTASNITANAIFLLLQGSANNKVTYQQVADSLPYVRSQFSEYFGEDKSYTNIVQALDSDIFPTPPPVVTSFSISGLTTDLEVGDTVSGAYTLNYTVSNFENVSGSLTLSSTTAGVIDTTISASTTSQGVTLPSISLSDTGSEVYTLSGTDTQGNTFSRTFSVNWNFVRMYFTYGSGDGNGGLLVGTRQAGDSRDSAIDSVDIGTTLDGIIADGNFDLNQSTGHTTQKWAAPALLGDEDDFRVYFVYQEDQLNASLISNQGEVTTVSQAFSWTRNGVTENYVIYSTNQDYAGSSSPLIGVS